MIQHPAAANKVYNIADDGVMGTRELVETIAEGLGVRPRLLSIPRWMMSLPASLIGKKPVIDRFFSDLEVDASALKRDTGWCPRVSLREGILAMARAEIRGI